MLAHGDVLASQFFEPDEVRELALDHHAAELEPVDVAVMDLAEKVAGDATGVTADDVDRLRELGLTDDEIVSVVSAAAARCFFSKALDALGVQPDASYASVEPGLREALVVGRPIASS
jgi:alkylhydroperoxidase family enzyme